MDVKVKTPAGTINLLLKDKNGRFLVAEVETNASDFAVSQVCRLASRYSKVSGRPLNALRKVVVCVNYEDPVVDASLGEVELYKVGCERVI